MCNFGSHTYVPISWKKQTSVSHISTESEINSLGAGLRMDGILALDLWDMVFEVLHSSSNQPKKSKDKVQGNLLHDTPSRNHTNSQVRTSTQHNDLELCNVDCVSSNVMSSQFGEMLYIFEDSEAVSKMIIKGRSPTLRRVSRTYRLALDWSCDTINLDPKIHIKYVDTKNQLADILTKGNFTRDQWNHLLHLFNIGIFSCASSKKNATRNRRRENCGKVEADAELGFASRCKLFYSAEFECIKPSGDTQSIQSRFESHRKCRETCRWRFKLQ